MQPCREADEPALRHGPMSETQHAAAVHATRALVGRAIAGAVLDHIPKSKRPEQSDDVEVLTALIVQKLGGVDAAVWDAEEFKLTDENEMRFQIGIVYATDIRPSLDANLRGDNTFSKNAVAAIAKAVAENNAKPLGLRGVAGFQLLKGVPGHMTVVAGDGSDQWRTEKMRRALHEKLNVISTAHMDRLLEAVAAARHSVALFTGPSGSGKTFALMLLAYSGVVGHVTCVVYSVVGREFEDAFNLATQQETASLKRASAGVDDDMTTEKLAECRALYKVFARRAVELCAHRPRNSDTIVFAVDEAGGRPDLLRTFCRAALKRFSLAPSEAKPAPEAKVLGDHLSDLLNGAEVRFVAAGTGIGATSCAKAGTQPESYECVSIEVPGLFAELMTSKAAADADITTANVPERIRQLLKLPPRMQVIQPTASEAREAALVLALVENPRCAIIAAVQLAMLFPTRDPIVPPECTVVLAHLQQTVAAKYKELNGLNKLTSGEYVTAVTLAMAAAVSDQVDPMSHLASVFLSGAGRSASHFLPMMLADNAVSTIDQPAVGAATIPGSGFDGTSKPLSLHASLRDDTLGAVAARRYVPRHTLQAAQAILATAVCDGRPSHTQSGEGFETAVIDACRWLARLMHPTARAMLRSDVPEPAAGPADPLPFVTMDRFVRILASKLDDVAPKPVHVAQLPHQFTKEKPFGLPESALKGTAHESSTGFTKQSFAALMHVARGNLSATTMCDAKLEELLADRGIFGSHYVLKNAAQASSADLIVILQGRAPGVFSVIFVQCKFASKLDTATGNAKQESIEKELAKTLVELQPAHAAVTVTDNDIVKPYFAIVQHCVPPNGDRHVRDRLGANGNVVTSGSVHSKYVASGVWLVSASEPSPLLPGLCNATDVVPSAEYLACTATTQRGP